jgi:NADPH:quinone reductase-like Zn-dependent oxidoreductase
LQARRCFECITRGGTVVSIAETPGASALQGKESYGVQLSGFVSFVLNCLSNSVAKAARRAQIEYDVFFAIGDGEALDEIRGLCEAKTIVPVIDRVFEFDKADAAIEYLELGHATGKVVVEIAAQEAT